MLDKVYGTQVSWIVSIDASVNIANLLTKIQRKVPQRAVRQPYMMAKPKKHWHPIEKRNSMMMMMELLIEQIG